MPSWLIAIPQWLHGWFDSTDATKDVKLMSFALVVVWAVHKLNGAPITDQWVNAFYGLCALVGLGGAAWALVDKQKDKSNGCSGDDNKP